MRPAFTGHHWDNVCTHKDYDLPCGCVDCLFCDLRMIICKKHTDNPRPALSDEIAPGHPRF